MQVHKLYHVNVLIPSDLCWQFQHQHFLYGFTNSGCEPAHVRAAERTEGSPGDNPSEVELFPFVVCVVPGEPPCCHRGMLMMLALGSEAPRPCPTTICKKALHVNTAGNKLLEKQKEPPEKTRLWMTLTRACTHTRARARSQQCPSLGSTSLSLPWPSSPGGMEGDSEPTGTLGWVMQEWALNNCPAIWESLINCLR